MQAYKVVFDAPRECVLTPIEAPEPGRAQVLVRTERTLISTGTELTALAGDFAPQSRWARYVRYPWDAGYSNAGVVVAVGDGVAEWQPGDRVASMARHGTVATVGRDRLWRIPDEVSDEEACFATLAEIAMNGVRRGRVTFGESVVIVGAGLLGQLAAQICRQAGASPVVVVDPAVDRLEKAGQLAGAVVLGMPVEEALRPIEDATRGGLADVVIEATGNPVVITHALQLARRMGRVVLLGSPRGPVSIDFHDEVHTLGLEIIGAHNSTHPPAETPDHRWTVARHVELFFDWLTTGRLNVRDLVTHRYAWRQTREAYTMLLEDRSQALGVVLDWSQE